MSKTGHIAEKKLTILELKKETNEFASEEDKYNIALVKFDHGEYCVGIGYDEKSHSWAWGHYHGTGIQGLIRASKEFNERTA